MKRIQEETLGSKSRQSRYERNTLQEAQESVKTVIFMLEKKIRKMLVPLRAIFKIWIYQFIEFSQPSCYHLVFLKGQSIGLLFGAFFSTICLKSIL
jgi:hypothetical protein